MLTIMTLLILARQGSPRQGATPAPCSSRPGRTSAALNSPRNRPSSLSGCWHPPHRLKNRLSAYAGPLLNHIPPVDGWVLDCDSLHLQAVSFSKFLQLVRYGEHLWAQPFVGYLQVVASAPAGFLAGARAICDDIQSTPSSNVRTSCLRQLFRTLGEERGFRAVSRRIRHLENGHPRSSLIVET